MSISLAALMACSAGVALAIFRRSQLSLLASVVAYAALTGWMVLYDLALLMPALIVAIALGVLAVARVVCRDVLTDVARCSEE